MNESTVTKNVREQFSSLAMYVLPYSFSMLLSKSTAKRLDNNFFQILEGANVKSLIECGANEATASMRANSLGLQALAIEANPETFKKITPQSTNNFKKVNFGLGKKNSSLNFYMPKANHTAGSATFKPKSGVEYETTKVQVRALDQLLSNTRYIESPFALWIDVEGMQYEVLNGMLGTLKRNNCKVVKIEVEDLEIFSGQRWLSREVVKFFEDLGFVLAYRDFEYAHQYNLLFVRSDVFHSSWFKKFYKFMFQRTRLTVMDTVKYLAKHKQIKREAKALALLLFGKQLGNRISAVAGSKESRKYLNKK